MGVVAACELGAAPLDASFGLADDHVHSAERPLGAEQYLVVAIGDHRLAGVGVADSFLDPSGYPAQRRKRVQSGKPGMVDSPSGLDQLFDPGDRLKFLDLIRSEERRVGK